MSMRYPGGFVTATYNPTAITSIDYLVVSGGGSSSPAGVPGGGGGGGVQDYL